jgi:SNF family Na+-dependent transporter
MSDQFLVAMLILGFALLSADLIVGLRRGRLIGPRVFGPAERSTQPVRFRLYIALYLFWLAAELVLLGYYTIVGKF